MGLKQKVLSNIAAHCHNLVMPVPVPNLKHPNHYYGNGYNIKYRKTSTRNRSRVIYRLSGSRFKGGPYELKRSIQFADRWQLEGLVKDEPASVGLLGAWLILRQLQQIKEEKPQRKPLTDGHRAAPV